MSKSSKRKTSKLQQILTHIYRAQTAISCNKKEILLEELRKAAIQAEQAIIANAKQLICFNCGHRKGLHAFNGACPIIIGKKQFFSVNTRFKAKD